MAAFLRSKFVLATSLVGSSIGGIVLLKDYVGGHSYKGSETLEGKVTIVTGCNTGIGKEVARNFARRGANVIMACRDLEKCEKARREIVLDSSNKKVSCQHLDLSSLESVRKFAEFINQNMTSLDILVNNAGIMRCPYSLTKDGFEMQLGVNHLGHFLLTNLLLEKLKANAPSRIINVSSAAHKRGEINFTDLNSKNSYDPAAAYAQSKLANILFTQELNKRIQGLGVTVYAVHPGIVNTEITRHMSFAKSYISSILAAPLLWLITTSPIKGAQTIIYCSLSPDVIPLSGKYFCNCKETKPSATAEDVEVSKRLWLTSEKWTHLT